MPKVIFTSLGPEKTFVTSDGIERKDGDVLDLNQVDYDRAVVRYKFAQDYDQELESKIKRLIASAEKKRKSILEKANKLKK